MGFYNEMQIEKWERKGIRSSYDMDPDTTEVTVDGCIYQGGFVHDMGGRTETTTLTLDEAQTLINTLSKINARLFEFHAFTDDTTSMSVKAIRILEHKISDMTNYKPIKEIDE